MYLILPIFFYQLNSVYEISGFRVKQVDVRRIPGQCIGFTMNVDGILTASSGTAPNIPFTFLDIISINEMPAGSIVGTFILFLIYWGNYNAHVNVQILV